MAEHSICGSRIRICTLYAAIAIYERIMRSHPSQQSFRIVYKMFSRILCLAVVVVVVDSSLWHLSKRKGKNAVQQQMLYDFDVNVSLHAMHNDKHKIVYFVFLTVQEEISGRIDAIDSNEKSKHHKCNRQRRIEDDDEEKDHNKSK